VTGVKNDSGKVIAGTITKDFGAALLAVSSIGTFGARKYSKSNWLQVPDGVDRYTDAMMRHFLTESTALYDSESNMLHAAHVAWNALARLELMLREGTDVSRNRQES